MPRVFVFLLLLLAVPVCHAQTAIHHCVSADGTPGFTDQPCSSLQSRKVGAVPAQTSHACSATRKALRQRVASAFTRHDANALAGLMLWQGYTDAGALREVAHFQQLMRRPLLEVTDDSPADSASVPATPLPWPAQTSSTNVPALPRASLEVHLGGVQPDNPGPLHFDVIFSAGCFWLLP
jgi:hypothetical protein